MRQTILNFIIEESLRLAWDEGPEAAIQYLNSQFDDESCYAQLHHALGIIHSNIANNRKNAEQHFRKAIQLDPFFTYSYWHLSKLLVDDERIDDALQVYQQGMDEKSKPLSLVQ